MTVPVPENIIESILITLTGVLISAASWLIKRVLRNSADIEKLIQLAEQKESHRQEIRDDLVRRLDNQDRQLMALKSQLDSIALLLAQHNRSQGLAAVSGGKNRGDA